MKLIKSVGEGGGGGGRGGGDVPPHFQKWGAQEDPQTPPFNTILKIEHNLIISPPSIHNTPYLALFTPL